MRKWLPSTLCVLLGLTLGFLIGYVAFLDITLFNNPAFVNIPARGDAFNRVAEGLARLSSDEAIVASKSAKSKLALSNEAEILHRLQSNVEQTDFSSPLKVAAARLLVRRSTEASKGDPETEAQIQDLLEKSGWSNPEPGHMRAAIETIDRNENSCNCNPSDVKGTSRQ